MEIRAGLVVLLSEQLGMRESPNLPAAAESHLSETETKRSEKKFLSVREGACVERMRVTVIVKTRRLMFEHAT